MPAQAQHHIWTAYLSGTTGEVALGSVMIPDVNGEWYVIATSAARTAAVRTTCVSGVAITYGDDLIRNVEIQTVGPCPQSITGLTAGLAAQLRVSTTGRLERVVGDPVEADIIVGRCDADGWAYLNMLGDGQGGGGGGGTTTTASNVGDGEGEVYKQRTVDDLELRTIKAGTGVTVTNNALDITLTAGPRTITDPDFWIDPPLSGGVGSDSNDGLTSLTPLATWAYMRDGIWGPGAFLNPTGGTMTVHIVNTLPSSDPMDLAVGQASNINGTFLQITGSPTTTRSGTITAVTAANRAANTPWDITDSAMAGTWTTDLRQRVTITSGARSGASWWVAKDLGSQKCRISSPRGTSMQEITPTVADPYTVQALPKVTNSNPWTPFVNVSFRLLDFQDQDFRGCYPDFTYCKFSFGIGVNDCTITLLNCCLARGIVANRGWLTFQAGLVADTTGTTYGVVCRGGRIDIFYDTMMQGLGQGLKIGGGSSAYIQQLSMFDCLLALQIGVGRGGQLGNTGGAGHVELYSRLVGAASQTDSYFWGSGNTGYAINLKTGGRFSYETGRYPTITASIGDFILDGTATARAFDEATGAYTTARACSWANLAATIAGGGFGDGGAHNVPRAVHVTDMP